MIRRLPTLLGVSIGTLIAISSLGIGQDKPKLGFKDTPMLPGDKWHVHDGDRPQPPVITPGQAAPRTCRAKHPPTPSCSSTARTSRTGGADRGEPAGWEVKDGAIVIKSGKGTIQSQEEFGDCQIHLEFASPLPARGHDQDRGNSGVLIFGRYEVQVLDSYGNLTYPDGQAAAIYGQYPPLVNASRPPGEWQSFDIIFTAPTIQARRNARIARL